MKCIEWDAEIKERNELIYNHTDNGKRNANGACNRDPSITNLLLKITNNFKS